MGGGDWHDGRGDRRQYDPRDDDRRGGGGGWGSGRGDRRSPPRGSWRERSRDRGEDEACRVWAGGLPGDITENEIHREFSRYGPVQEIVIKHSPKDTFAFVLYSKEGHARDAIDAFDQAKVFGGVTIKVAPAKRKSPDDPGSKGAGKGYADRREDRRDDYRPSSRRDDDRGGYRDRDDYTRGYDDRKGGGNGKMQFETRPGDWNCPECNDLQFARNAQCRKCGCPKPRDTGSDHRSYDRGSGQGRDRDIRHYDRDVPGRQGRVDYRALNDEHHQRRDRGRPEDFGYRGGRDERRQERSRSPKARRRFRVSLENLPSDMAGDELAEICQEFGEVQSYDLWNSGRAKHGLVEFRTREGAQRAIQELNDRQIQEWDMRLKAFFSS